MASDVKYTCSETKSAGWKRKADNEPEQQYTRRWQWQGIKT